MKDIKNSTAVFLAEESGAVTVDWVVLTAATVGLGLAVMAVVSAGVEDLSGDVNTQLASTEVTASFSGGEWEAGARLDWSDQDFDDMVDIWATVGDVDNSLFGANEALGLAEAGAPDSDHQLDAAAAHITALNQMGEDTTDLQARYDAAYADYVANNS